jgi:hypothetical protein
MMDTTVPIAAVTIAVASVTWSIPPGTSTPNTRRPATIKLGITAVIKTPLPWKISFNITERIPCLPNPVNPSIGGEPMELLKKLLKVGVIGGFMVYDALQIRRLTYQRASLEDRIRRLNVYCNDQLNVGNVDAYQSADVLLTGLYEKLKAVEDELSFYQHKYKS